MNEQEAAAWQKEKPFRIELDSGRVCYVRRPSPGMVLRVAKIQRLLSKTAVATEGEQGADRIWAFLDSLSEEDAERFASQAVELVLDVMVEPKLFRDPKSDQLGIVDLGNDFWPLYGKAMSLMRDQPVALDRGETTVDAVETFPGGSSAEVIPGDDGAELQGASC